MTRVVQHATPMTPSDQQRIEESMYTLTDVTKTYRKDHHSVTAVDDLNLTIAEGEWLAIQGRTGSGKTTLLQLLGALDHPSSGVINFDGRDLAHLPEADLTDVRADSIGFVFQTFNLIPTLSARENVEVALIPQRLTAAERRERATEALASVGLADRATHLPSEMSGGSSNESGSPAPWSKNPECSWPTSPPATSTWTPATRSWRCSKCCGETAASPSCWSPTTPPSPVKLSASPPCATDASRSAPTLPGPKMQMTTEPRRPVAALLHRQPRSGPSSTVAGPRRYPRIDRFALTYLRRELRGRLRQALLIALGLGFGVGLVIIVTAASAGVSNAQSTVLHSLYGIGTDLTVTKPATAAANSPADTAGGGLQQNTLQEGSLGRFPATWVTSIAHLAHVASVAGGLDLSELTELGGIPQTIPVEGVDLTHPGLGPLSSGTLKAGHNFSAIERSSDVAILDADYAATNKLSVGSSITVAGTTFHVIGLVNQTQGSAADIYIPLTRAQTLAQTSTGKSLTGQINVIYVAAATSSKIPDVENEISRLLPAATVSGTSDLASEVSGSLGSAANLTNDLGKWVAAAALLAAFAVASLLTTGAVNRRVRELGTLKALGWPAKRIITQIMSESAATGIIGAVLGIAIGFAGTALVDAVAPELSATVPQQNGTGGTTTVAVHLAAHVSPTAVLVAILLAVTGALIAGATGARRATQLQPADAFAQVE